MTLMTARYNWRLGELSMGRREIARLWAVDERTVKRDLGKLKALALLSVKRPGVRGRVTVYSLDLDAIVTRTREGWDRVGPDFSARMAAMAGDDGSEGQGGVAATSANVVPLHPSPALAIDLSSIWGRARQALRLADPATYRSWFQPLAEAGEDDGALTLTAPSLFHARYVEQHLMDPLLAAVSSVEPSIRKIRLGDACSGGSG